MKKIFIDTNLIVYANDSRDSEKQQKAIAVIQGLMQTGQGVISSQVLQEYANTALVKLHQQHAIVLRQLTLLESSVRLNMQVVTVCTRKILMVVSIIPELN